jgi:acyl-CoA thioesterase-2
MASTLEQFLKLKNIGIDMYESCDIIAGGFGIAYGGHLVASTCKAGLHTLPNGGNDYLLNSLHCFYTKPVKPSRPVQYHINEKKNGQTFCYRSIAAKQDGANVAMCNASFRSSDDPPINEVNYNSQIKPDVPSPMSCVPYEDLRNMIFFRYLEIEKFPFAIRIYSPSPWDYTGATHVPMEPLPPRIIAWIRPRQPLGSCSNQNDHRIGLACESDLMNGIILIQFPHFQFDLLTSIDHSIWMEHHTVNVNEWHLFDIQCLSSHNGVILSISRIFIEDGTLIATAVQQSYIRKAHL